MRIGYDPSGANRRMLLKAGATAIVTHLCETPVVRL